MMSSELNLNTISYQDAIRSKQLRENFTDIQNEHNLLRNEFYASVASTASEVTNARNGFSALVTNIEARKKFGNVIVLNTDYKVTAYSGLKTKIAKGSGIVDGKGVYSATYATAGVTKPASGKKRYDCWVVGSDSARSIISGTATTGTPVYPSIASTEMVVSDWIIYATTNTLSVHIKDRRAFVINPFIDEYYNDETYSYSGNTLSSIISRDSKGSLNTYAVNYAGGTIASLGVSIDGVRFTEKYTYTNNTLTSSTFEIK